jgi:hypothetical protein
MLMAMLCPKCGKESNNIRVCAFCQTPYPTGGSAQSGRPRKASALWSRAKRWWAIGLFAAFALGYYVVRRGGDIPVGVAIENVFAGPMSRNEATSTLNALNGSAQVEVRDGELTVRIAAGKFPEQREGQLAFAQQYARADAIIQGRKRAISFLDPDGSPFARADPATGVSMSR